MYKTRLPERTEKKNEMIEEYRRVKGIGYQNRIALDKEHKDILSGRRKNKLAKTSRRFNRGRRK